MDAAYKLSRLQKHILTVIFNQQIYIEANMDDDAKSNFKVCGVPWYPAAGHNDWTRSDSAVIPRALRRLQARGLVERKNLIDANPRRATGVKLTPLGTDIVETTNKINVSHL